MQKITLDEFCQHWVTGSRVRIMASKLSTNVFNFTTAVGDYSRDKFVSSFSSGRFCGTGAPWAPRQSRWGKRFTHPVLVDRGTLARSIKSDTTLYEHNQSGANYQIWTTEKSVAEKGKRGENKERYGHYAAIHNTDPKFGLYTVNQYSSRRPEHRQFIGFSPEIEDYVEANFLDMIFEGFPK